GMGEKVFSPILFTKERLILRYADIVSGIVFAVFGAVIVLATLSFPSAAAGDLGAAFFPRIIGCLLILLGLLLAIVSFLKKNNRENLKPFFGGKTKKVVGTLIIFTLYLVFLNIIGFLVANFLFMAGLSRFLDEKRWLVIIGVSVVFTGFIYYIFQITLGIPLPSGMFFG
ncbi:MAG TPA: tripartite tricarboxylate transporter TctB family protein, partial [Bacillales bacterium]|nr:tripartite tricarboxylate transporter TctB family protein [Bacillales bacterium]